jgi:hypothetical protein
MAELTCRERVVRCCIGETIDRMPYGVGLGWDPWGEALDNFRRDGGSMPEWLDYPVKTDDDWERLRVDEPGRLV